MIKLKDLLNEGKYTVYFDVGSPGLMSKTVSAKNEKEAGRQVASGLKGGAKLIKKIEKESVDEAIKKVSDAEDGAGYRQDWIGVYKGKMIQFKANFPADAKKHTIDYFKVSKSSWGDVIVVSKKEYDSQQGWHKQYESVNERMNKRQGGETLKQLGGNRFIAMTGAKNFAVGPKGMSFKIGRNSKNVNYVRIDLKGDLYNMEFIQMRAGKMKVKSKEKGVYNDQLQKMFTKNTGMYTSL